MEKAAKVLLGMAAMALAAGCGEGARPSSPTAVLPSIVIDTPPKAHLTVTLGPETVVGPSQDPAYAEFVRFTTSLTESAGLGASLNYVRGDFFLAGVPVERYEVSAEDLVEETGSNRVEARSSRSLTITFRCNGQADLIRTLFQFTDDKGHDHHIAGNLVGAAR